jgi:hypothetical protein
MRRFYTMNEPIDDDFEDEDEDDNEREWCD